MISLILAKLNLELNYFQIILDEDLRATGVKFVRDGKVFHATATKEIIISAGAINTPKLLMLSGIGPTAHLLEHGVR